MNQFHGLGLGAIALVVGAVAVALGLAFYTLQQRSRRRSDEFSEVPASIMDSYQSGSVTQEDKPTADTH